MRSFILSMCAFLAMATMISADTFYVSPNGDDNEGDGTLAKPFKTISRPDALNLLNPGDTVSIMEGTYIPNMMEGFILRNCSGTKDMPITYKGEGEVVIDSATILEKLARDIVGCISVGQAYYPLKGIRFENITFKITQFGVFVADGSENISVVNCKISGIRMPGKSIYPLNWVCAGIVFGKTNDSLCENNVFENIKGGDVSSAVSMAYDAKVKMSKNTFTDVEAEVEYWNANDEVIKKFPATPNYQVYYGDFHMHTTWSDGALTIEERFLESKVKGLDIVTITDHGPSLKSKGGLEKQVPLAKALADKYDVLYINGFETGLAYAPLGSREHCIAFDLTDGFEPESYDHGMTEDDPKSDRYYENRIKKIVEDGKGIMFWAHPNSDNFIEYPEVGNELVDGYARKPYRWAVDNGYFIGIELFNGASSYGGNGRYWGEDLCEIYGVNGGWYWPKAFRFALDHGLTMFANTDVHGYRQPSYTLVFAKERTHEAVIDAINNRRTVAYFDNMLWGRKAMLKELLLNAITVKKSAGEATITNNTPMRLTAAIDGTDYIIIPDKSITVKTSGDLEINWKNMWISPEETLVLTYY